MSNSRNFNISRTALPIIIEEAKELYLQAVNIDNLIQEEQATGNPSLGKMISANILIALSIELYLKSFMLAGRNLGIVGGHNLIKLYDEFPEAIKEEIESRYRARKKSSAILLEVAYTLSDTKPDVPEADPFDGVDFEDFRSTLSAVSNKFVESRYFFEKITSSSWAIFKYYLEPCKFIAEILSEVLEEYRLGKFKGKIA